jgi:protein-S-isoprenylcysteine O-methyltransferase Ste14
MGRNRRQFTPSHKEPNRLTNHLVQVRESARVVATGPYHYVRHPLYACVLGMQLTSAVMFWNKIPLYAAAISAIAFAIKMPIEVCPIFRSIIALLNTCL